MEVVPELDSAVESESLLEQPALSFVVVRNGIGETPPQLGQQPPESTPRGAPPDVAATVTVGPAPTRRGGDQEQSPEGPMDGQNTGRLRGASWMRSCGHGGFEAGQPCVDCECVVCLEQSPDAVLLECGHGFEPCAPRSHEPSFRACDS